MPRLAVETGQWPTTVPRCMTVMVCVEIEMFAVTVAAVTAGACANTSPKAVKMGMNLFMTKRCL